jgi:endonuclease/exonuclease/phosphatase family metal-dependent hydrolase
MRIILIISFFLHFVLLSCNNPKQNEIRIMSFNIRYDNPADAPSDWKSRLPLIEQYIASALPDIMGVQEALFHQNEDLLKIMPGYAYLGQGRDDGKQSGEYCSVFYRTEIFEVLDHSQFWLSETPAVPGSIGWEAILPRIVTWVHFKHRGSGKQFYFFNTHYSHVSDGARRRSLELTSEMIKQIAGNEPVILTGDFNIPKDSDLYHNMIINFMNKNELQNAALLAVDTYRNAPTFNGFSEDIDAGVIDYIFFSRNFFSFKNYAVDKVADGRVYISDHWPVRASFTLPDQSCLD